jgi:hypothetical protein
LRRPQRRIRAGRLFIRITAPPPAPALTTREDPTGLFDIGRLYIIATIGWRTARIECFEPFQAARHAVATPARAAPQLR